MRFGAKSFEFTEGEPCRVIGEIGVNHNNDPELLFKLIDVGVAAGCDIIKLQRFSAEAEISGFAEATDYQKKAGETVGQLEMAKRLELADEYLVKGAEYCRDKGVGFLCTAFDHGSVDFVADRLGATSVKVPSPEISNKPLLEHMARKFAALLVSTGASRMSEAALALDWILDAQPEANLLAMHCVSEYPAPMSDANLRAIPAMRAALGAPIGYSDHTEGIVAAVVAASLGAVVVEKHYTLDRSLPGPDHMASLEPGELHALCDALQQAHLSLGDGIKRPQPSEQRNRPLIRKNLTCNAQNLPTGHCLRPEDLGVKRPAVEGGVAPADLDKVLGLRLAVAKRFDEPIRWSDFRTDDGKA